MANLHRRAGEPAAHYQLTIRRVIGALAASGLIALVAGCSGSENAELDDVYAWPSYLPDDIKVVGSCLNAYAEGAFVTSPELLADDRSAIGIGVGIFTNQARFEDLPGVVATLLEEFPTESSVASTVRGHDGIAFEFQPTYSDLALAGVAWQEPGILAYVFGIGLPSEEVRAVAESLQPSSADRFAGCSAL